MKFWNIGAEGQVLIGGVAAAYFAIFHPETFSRPVLLIVMALAAALAGGLWAFIPAFFKAKWGTNETLFTLMQNYLALSLVLHLATVKSWQDPGQDFTQIARIDLVARLPNIFGLHIGWILILVLTVLVHLYLARSKWGFQLTVVGQSPNTARYAGMNVGWIIMRTMLVSGAIGGFVGYLQVAGADYTLTMYTAGGVGFTAIIVAWISQLKPFAMVGMAAFIAILERGSLRIQRVFGIEETIASIIVGIILFFMIACEFFNNYYVIFRKRKGAS
jgi:simple sugar transport system permease protein